MKQILGALEDHKAEGTYRSLSPQKEGQKEELDFSSNDYLGLSRCPRIRKRLAQDLEAGCPMGATGSRLLSGQSESHARVESFLSNIFDAPSALLFSSGYMANLGLLSAFGTLGAEFFSDTLNHASLVDGMRLAKSPRTVFRHNDMDHLEDSLSHSPSRLKVIVSESVFSMDGDLAPLTDLIMLSEKFGTWLVIDEAHATGIFGTHGLGRLEGVHRRQSKLIAIHTGGKALGGQGAFVLANTDFRELLINRARSFVFSTALSPLNCLQIQYAVEEVINRPYLGSSLLKASDELRTRLLGLSGPFQSRSQIVPLVLGSNERALATASQLQKRGFDVRAVRSPTVPKGTERLRITLKSFHRPSDLAALACALEEFIT